MRCTHTKRIVHARCVHMYKYLQDVSISMCISFRFGAISSSRPIRSRILGVRTVGRRSASPTPSGLRAPSIRTRDRYYTWSWTCRMYKDMHRRRRPPPKISRLSWAHVTLDRYRTNETRASLRVRHHSRSARPTDARAAEPLSHAPVHSPSSTPLESTTRSTLEALTPPLSPHTHTHQVCYTCRHGHTHAATDHLTSLTHTHRSVLSHDPAFSQAAPRSLRPPRVLSGRPGFSQATPRSLRPPRGRRRPYTASHPAASRWVYPAAPASRREHRGPRAIPRREGCLRPRHACSPPPR